MKSLLLIVAIIGFVASLPIDDAVEKQSEPADIALGDMLISSRQKRILYPKNKKVKNGLIKPSEIWPNATVYYTFGPGIRKLLSITVKKKNS